MDAVYAFAYGLHDLHADVCRNYNAPTLCSEMASYDGGDFYKRYLLNVSFKGKTSFFQFCQFPKTFISSPTRIYYVRKLIKG